MNFDSPEWHEIQTLVTERIAQLDEHNRKPHAPDSTAFIRGQIAALLWLMDYPARVSEPPESEEINLQP